MEKIKRLSMHIGRRASVKRGVLKKGIRRRMTAASAVAKRTEDSDDDVEALDTDSIPSIPIYLRNSNERGHSRRNVKANSSILRFKGLSIAYLETFYERLLKEELCPNVKLGTITKVRKLDQGVVPKGSTVRLLKSLNNGEYLAETSSGERFKLPAKYFELIPRSTWTLSHIRNYVVLPSLEDEDSTFVDTCPRDSGTFYAGVFVIASPESVFRDLLQSLIAKCEKKGVKLENQFAWIDIFGCTAIGATNPTQATVVEEGWGGPSPSFLDGYLETAVGRFDERLIFIGSWDTSSPLNDLWELYTIYVASIAGGVDGLLLPPGHEEDFPDMMLENFDHINANLRNLDSRAASCGNLVAEGLLREALQGIEDGYSALNKVVTAELSKWLASSVSRAVNIKRLTGSGEELADFLNRAGLLVHGRGQYLEAIRLYKEALFIYKNHASGGSNKHDLSTSRVMNNLGNALMDQGKYEESLEVFEEDLRICTRVLGSEHPELATTLNNSALLLDEMGDHEESLERYKRALAIRQKSLGENAVEVAETLNNIASHYYARRDFARAEGYYEDAINIFNRALGSNSPQAGEAMCSLATTLSASGKLEKALEFFQSCLLVRRINVNERSLAVASALFNVGNTLDDLGRYEEAIEAFKEALAIYSDHCGQNCTHVGMTMIALASVYHAKGAFKNALGCYAQANNTLQQKHGRVHPDVGTALYNMAQTYEKMHLIHQALKTSLEAADCYSKYYGENHPDTRDARDQATRLKELINKS